SASTTLSPKTGKMCSMWARPTDIVRQGISSRAPDFSEALHTLPSGLRLRERRSSPRRHAALDGRITAGCTATAGNAGVRGLAGRAGQGGREAEDWGYQPAEPLIC